jgi:hypothetical protein
VDTQPLELYAALAPLEICAALETSPHGLESAEADARLAREGLNEITDPGGPSIFVRLVRSFVNWG